MAVPVRIPVAGAAEAADLARALAIRGFGATTERAEDGLVLVVRSTSEATERLLGELLPALAAWCDDRGRGSLAIRVGTERVEVPSTVVAA